MIICNCNNLRESEINKACAYGATCADEVMDALGCEFKCGRCEPFVQAILSLTNAESQVAVQKPKKPMFHDENPLQQSAY